jgi:predicted transcriptional regulator
MKASITTKITEEEKFKLLEIAEREDRTLSYVVRQIIKEYLEKQTQSK